MRHRLGGYRRSAVTVIDFFSCCLKRRSNDFCKPENPQKLPLPLGDRDPHLWFLRFTESAPNGISIGSAIFCWAHERDKQTVTYIHTDRQTDRPRYCVCSRRPLSFAIAAMRPNNEH